MFDVESMAAAASPDRLLWVPANLDRGISATHRRPPSTRRRSAIERALKATNLILQADGCRS